MHRLQDSGRNQGKTGQLIAPAPAKVTTSAGLASRAPAYRGRFAPTPSGPLHLGSLLTALASYLDARASGGQWLVRIDDLDPPRTKAGQADLILRTLEALALEWDEAVTYQSAHHEAYQQALDLLLDQGRLYACQCTRREKALPTPSKDGACPGRCRLAKLSFRPGEHGLRIKTPEAPVSFRDRIKGLTERSLRAGSGDFVLFRRDKIYAYHLATVVDEHHMGITHVVRGEDLLDATAQQIFLQQVLEYETPLYAHTPLMISPDGRKLSKSEGAPPVLPEQGARVIHFLLPYLGLLLPKSLEGGSAHELVAWAVQHWNIDRLKGTSAVVINENTIPA